MLGRFLIFILVAVPWLGQSQSNNPFDIVRSTDTNAVVATSIIPVKEQSTQEVTKIQGDNPFTISHIPIRKNQYKQIESLKIERNDIQKENISIGYIPLWIIIFSMCLVAYMLFLKKNHIAILLKSLMNDNFMKLTNYEENGGKKMAYILGYFLFLINFTLFLHLVTTKIFSFDQPYQVFYIFGVIVIFFLGKHVINGLFSWVYEFGKMTQVYDFTIVTVRNLMSIIFLCLNILLVFGPDIWSKGIASFGVFVFISFLISRYYKGIRIGRFYINNYFFHFFLYFCAFEISPWVVVFKIIRDLN